MSLVSLLLQEELADPFLEEGDSDDLWQVPPLSPSAFPDLMHDDRDVYGHAPDAAPVVLVPVAAYAVPVVPVAPAAAVAPVAPFAAVAVVPLVVIDDSGSDSDEDMGSDSDDFEDGRPYAALRRRLAIDRDGDCIFAVAMPDGVALRFSNISAALHAFQCYCLDRDGLMLQRPDLAAAFSKDGDLGWLSGARTQAHRFQQVLLREGLTVRAEGWALLQEGFLHVVVLARALTDEGFALDCRMAVHLQLSQSLPQLRSSLDKLAQAMYSQA